MPTVSAAAQARSPKPSAWPSHAASGLHAGPIIPLLLEGVPEGRGSDANVTAKLYIEGFQAQHPMGTRRAG